MLEFWYEKVGKNTFRVYTYCYGTKFSGEKEAGYYVQELSRTRAKKLLCGLKRKHCVEVRKGTPPATDTVHRGDCLEVLKNLPDNCVDLLCPDPPYGLTSVDPKRPGGGSGTAGFMNEKWDAAVPGVEVWKECLRVMKPGAFAFILCTPRQDCYSRMILNLEKAGFVTGFSSIFWTYSTGMNKSQNLSKEADKKAGVTRKVVGKRKHPTLKDPNKIKRKGKNNFHGNNTVLEEWDITAPATQEAQRLDGAFAGFQPKPAVEPIIVVMKPLEQIYRSQIRQVTGWGYWVVSSIEIKESNLSKYAKKWGISFKTGDVIQNRLSLDPEACDELVVLRKGKKRTTLKTSDYRDTDLTTYLTQALINGKGCTWLNSCRIPSGEQHRTKCRSVVGLDSNRNRNCYGEMPSLRDDSYSPRGRVPANLLVQDDMLNDGTVRRSCKSTKKHKAYKGDSSTKMLRGESSPNNQYDDSGSFSRYFNLDAWFTRRLEELPDKVGRTFPFLIVKKPSPREKNAGLDKPNKHPTVKPVELYTFLITLGSRPGDVVLDPYTGSGTAGVAAAALDRRFIGIDLNETYVHTAVARIKHVKKRAKKRLFKR